MQLVGNANAYEHRFIIPLAPEIETGRTLNREAQSVAFCVHVLLARNLNIPFQSCCLNIKVAESYTLEMGLEPAISPLGGTRLTHWGTRADKRIANVWPR